MSGDTRTAINAGASGTVNGWFVCSTCGEPQGSSSEKAAFCSNAFHMGQRPPCGCPVCRIQRALREIDAAHDAWLDQSTDDEMNLAHLHDELAAALAVPWWRWPFQRERLRAALVTGMPTGNGWRKRHAWARGNGSDRAGGAS